MYYIYILYSDDADKYYVGHSSNPWTRLDQHLNNPSEKFTGKYHDWRLVAVYQVSDNRGEAMKIEKFIKRQKSRSLIVALVEGKVLDGVLSQLVSVPHVRD